MPISAVIILVFVLLGGCAIPRGDAGHRPIRAVATLQTDGCAITEVREGILLYNDGGRLMKCELSTGEISQVYEASVPPAGAYCVDGDIYFASKAIQRVPESVQAPTFLTTVTPYRVADFSPPAAAGEAAVAQPRGGSRVGIIAGNVYWLAEPYPYGYYKLYRMDLRPRHSTVPVELMSGASFPNARLLVNGQDVIVGSATAASIELRRVDTGTGEASLVACLPRDRVIGSVDGFGMYDAGDRVYVYHDMEMDCVCARDGSVRHLANNGVPLVASQDGVCYWLSTEYGEVHRLHRDDGSETRSVDLPSDLLEGRVIHLSVMAEGVLLFVEQSTDSFSIYRASIDGRVEAGPSFDWPLEYVKAEGPDSLFFKENGGPLRVLSKDSLAVSIPTDFAWPTLGADILWGELAVTENYYVVKDRGSGGDIYRVPRGEMVEPVPLTPWTETIVDCALFDRTLLWIEEDLGALQQRTVYASDLSCSRPTAMPYQGDPPIAAMSPCRVYLGPESYCVVASTPDRETSWVFDRETRQPLVELNEALGERFYRPACMASAGGKLCLSGSAIPGIYAYDPATGVALLRGEAARELLIAGDELYWADSEGLHAAPLSGGESELLFAGECRSLRADGGSLYWVSGFQVLKMAL